MGARLQPPKSRIKSAKIADFGYPQPPTTIHCDNEVAVGMANRTINNKAQDVEVLRHALSLASGSGSPPSVPGSTRSRPL